GSSKKPMPVHLPTAANPFTKMNDQMNPSSRPAMTFGRKNTVRSQFLDFKGKVNSSASANPTALASTTAASVYRAVNQNDVRNASPDAKICRKLSSPTQTTRAVMPFQSVKL